MGLKGGTKIGVARRSPIDGARWFRIFRPHAESPNGRLVPVFMLSTSSPTDNASEAYLRGANAYTQKTVTYAGWKDYVAQLRQYRFEKFTTPDLYLQAK